MAELCAMASGWAPTLALVAPLEKGAASASAPMPLVGSYAYGAGAGLAFTRSADSSTSTAWSASELVRPYMVEPPS